MKKKMTMTALKMYCEGIDQLSGLCAEVATDMLTEVDTTHDAGGHSFDPLERLHRCVTGVITFLVSRYYIGLL